MKKDPTNVTRWKHKSGFQKRVVQWDAPMLIWAEEEKDWIQLVVRRPLRKEDAMISLLKMMRQQTEEKQKGGGIRRKKPRDLSPLVLETLTDDRTTKLEMRGDSKMVVEWVNGHAKLKALVSTNAAAQNLMWKWRSRGIDRQRRAAGWALHFFRERNEEADIQRVEKKSG